MKRVAAKVVAPRQVALLEEEIPVLAPDDVLIQVSACGVCITELDVFEGKVQGTPGVSFRYKDFPSDLGHEVVGVAADVGKNVEHIKVGQEITGIVYSGCGFATHIIEKADKLVPAPSSVPLNHALGEPIMAIMNIVRLGQPDYGDSIVVIGTGFMGLLTVAALSQYPTKDVIVVGHHQERLDMAKQYGATMTIDGSKHDPWKMIMDQTNGKGADLVFEISGKMAGLRLGASVCKSKQRAKLVMAGVYEQEPFNLGSYLQNRAPVLIPAYPNQSPNMMDDLQRGMWALEKGLLPISELVTHQFSLEQVEKALELANTKQEGYIKGIIIP